MNILYSVKTDICYQSKKQYITSWKFSLVIFAVCAFSKPVISLHAPSSDIVIGGSGTGLGTFKILAAAFMKSQSAIRIKVLPSLGSNGGIRALNKDFVQIALLSRPPKPSEKTKHLKFTHYATTPLVFAVSIENPAMEINSHDLLDYYSGAHTKWSDGQSVRPVLRPKADSDTLTLLDCFPQFKPVFNKAYQKRSIAIALTDQEMVKQLTSIPGSIGTSSLSLILSEKAPLRPLKLDGVTPSPETLKNKKYKLYKKLYYATKVNPSPRVKRFIKFLYSKQALKILKNTGHLITLQSKTGN